MLRTLLVSAVIVLSAFAARAEPHPSHGQEQMGISGTIGAYPIALVVTLRDHTEVIAAHYSYASRKTPIPLTGDARNGGVTFQEPGGGIFQMTFTTSDKSASKPLTFYTSTGLIGTWTRGSMRLPVRLQFVEAGRNLRDCAFYPAEAQPAGQPKFPNTGCEHTPDRAAIEHCIGQPFTTDKAAAACALATTRPCRDDQQDLNMCFGNLESYLDQAIRRRLVGSRGGWDLAAYKRWIRLSETGCRKRSPFSPDGSGYGGDIAMCMAHNELSLLQQRQPGHAGAQPPQVIIPIECCQALMDHDPLHTVAAANRPRRSCSNRQRRGNGRRWSP